VVDSVASWRDAPVFTERQRAAFAWAETVTEIPRTGATDEEYRAAATSFSDRELVELTLAIALMNAFARMAIAFRHGPPPTPARAR
jgi:alkylhydroperoxidase family enzyme